ncbi:MAG: hypothetical protein C5B59_07795 [Bacteroidetes bacterium]|nr:MAG: hypothetical protein C5B59_07795 [Bacteroidota bacterium]
MKIKHFISSRKTTELWANEKSFMVLLVLLNIQIFIIIPYSVHWGIIGKFILAIFYFVLLWSGLISVAKSRPNSVIIGFSILMSALLCLVIFFHGNWVRIVSDSFFAVYFSALAVIVLIRTFAQGPVTFYRIQGSIVVYLLISLIFALLYDSIFLSESQTAFKGLQTYDRDEFMYFSLATLTTLGYGDITPVNIPARSLSTLEGLIGQLYPAILIARLVSMELMSAKKK